MANKPHARNWNEIHMAITAIAITTELDWRELDTAAAS